MYDLSLQNFTTLPLVQYSTLALNCRLDRIDLSYHILLYCHNIDTNTIASSEQVSKQCLNISSGHMDLQFTYVRYIRTKISFDPLQKKHCVKMTHSFSRALY